MQTLGIDLSTDPKKVWMCEIDWAQSPPRITALDRLGESRAVRREPELIAELVERIVAFGPSGERVVGVDAPLGWPTAFVEAVSDWDEGDLSGFRKRPDLRLRATDRFVQAVARVTPMSVSTDRLGSTAMLLAEVVSRAARRLDRQGFARATGADGIAEVHPLAALRTWTYDGAEPMTVGAYKSWDVPRELIVVKIARAGFQFTPEQAAALVRNDDALDAFVCALIARAVVLGRCVAVADPVDAQQLVGKRAAAGTKADSVEQLTERLDLARAIQVEAARTADAEGWIQMPVSGDFATALGLVPDSAAWVPEPTPPPEPIYREPWLDEEDDDDAYFRARPMRPFRGEQWVPDSEQGVFDDVPAEHRFGGAVADLSYDETRPAFDGSRPQPGPGPSAA